MANQPTLVEDLKARVGTSTAFLCGSADNNSEVLELFDLVACLVLDTWMLRYRLQTRTTNAFGHNPEERASAVGQRAISRCLPEVGRDHHRRRYLRLIRFLQSAQVPCSASVRPRKRRPNRLAMA